MLEQFRIRIITGHDDGCYVQVKEQEDGKLLLTLLSPYFDDLTKRETFSREYSYNNIVDEAVIEKEMLFNAINCWHDY